MRPGFIFIADAGERFLLRTNRDGHLRWDQTLDATQGTKVRQDADGRFVVGSTFATEMDAGKDDAVVINHARFFRTDQDGELIWRRDYGTDSQMHDFDLTEDGGFVFTGHSPSYGENWDCTVTRVSGAGEEAWTKVFGQPRRYDARFIHDECYGVRQTPDGGFVAVGGTGDEYGEYAGSGHPLGVSNEWKAYVIRLDGNGGLLWEAVYGGNDHGNTAAEYVGLTSDGGYIVFNDMDNYGEDRREDIGFMKLLEDAK
jgi:hypothetical protein